MLRCTPEALAERWVPGDGPVDIQPLGSGLVNDSYRVARGGRLYSLRVAADHGGDLGLDRRWECQVLRLAAAAGLAPPIRHCDSGQGILTADWIGGRPWAAGEERLPANIDAVAGLLRRVHALPIPRPARSMNPAAWIAHYAGATQRNGACIPPAFASLRETAEAHLQSLAEVRPVEPVLCHSDVHRLNLVVGDCLVLLDWEYAHVSDPYWDLASWIANNDWPEEAANRLLVSYLGRPADDDERRRLRLLAWLYDYVALAWAGLYLSLRGGASSPDAATQVSQRAMPTDGDIRVAAAAGVSDAAARAEFLSLRLKRAPGSRAGEVPAHYPA